VVAQDNQVQETPTNLLQLKITEKLVPTLSRSKEQKTKTKQSTKPFPGHGVADLISFLGS
jgi:hypothetical protein